MRKQFDIKYRPQIESGEYKIIYLSYTTGEESPARIICWDRHNEYSIVALVSNSGGYERAQMFQEEGIDNNNPHLGTLFIVTPEEELTEFEQAVEAIYESCNVKQLALKKKAAELLSLAIDARANELYEGLKHSKLDEDSIPYHLIEFMCNLYDCPNWKEIEETAELYVTRIKAAAMKDLPRWKKCEHEMHTLTNLLIRSIDAMWIGAYVKDGQYYIPTNDLILKLPGFKED